MIRGCAVRLRGWGWRHAGRSSWAVRGVDLDIQPGERVLLLGPSGAGKSTLLHAMAGLLDAASGESEGEIVVDGRDPRLARDRTGLVMQDPQSQLVMARAGDDVAFGLENLEVPRGEIWPRVDEAFAAVGFPYGRDHPTDRLSGGEQQRLVLAGTAALRPGILLLDEPTANLDPSGAAIVRTALRRVLVATSATLVLVEHRVGEALDLVDRVVVVAPGGGVVVDGPVGDVFAARGAELAASGVWVPGLPPPEHPSAGPPGAALLGAERVSFRYPGAAAAAVRAADFELHAGEAVAIVGPSGSGKSTLALLLAGLVAPTEGAVCGRPLLGGPRQPLHEWPADRLADRIGTVFQDPEHQFLCRTVADELALGLRRTARPAPVVRARVDSLLERLHLEHLATANPFTLSGGEKRRLSVATALATDPRVLILDEPTFGQDRRTWLELLSMLSGLRDQGSGICCVTHDEAFAAAIGDRRLVMTAGTLGSALPGAVDPAPPAPPGAAAPGPGPGPGPGPASRSRRPMIMRMQRASNTAQPS